MSNDYLIANWDAPFNINALTTKRQGGQSQPPFDSFNLANHVGDKKEHVSDNRLKLYHDLNLPSTPIWLNQIHSNRAIFYTDPQKDADAIVCNRINKVLAIMTADCLPVLLTNTSGTEVAAIHAGWRGLANGIIANTLEMMATKPNNLIAWIGPAISQTHFEVSLDVIDHFKQLPIDLTEAINCNDGNWSMSLETIASLHLQNLGVRRIFQSGQCSYAQKNDYFSYRRDQQTGRMASLIWISE
jgi:purine-nucleoside/S-methyl-5'-thioadenosine phosphorylase / adenosine deaminase